MPKLVGSKPIVVNRSHQLANPVGVSLYFVSIGSSRSSVVYLTVRNAGLSKYPMPYSLT